MPPAANPLAQGLGVRRQPDPCALVVFGASGDLTKRKLLPALYSLAFRGLLPERFAVVGVARSEQTTRQFVTAMRQAVKQFARDPFRTDVFESLAAGMRYVSTDFADDGGEDSVGQVLDELDETRGTGGNRLHYLAVPPQAFPVVVREIGERREREGWARVIIEKPFGHDLASARELSASVKRWFAEDEIFRIDHYLGKETVQNLMALRFANGIFEPIWNRQMVDHVQITVAESMGIEGRAGYYEQAGVIRDIFQNHLLQLLALTAMEPPIDFSADAVRNEKVKVLRAMHTPGPKSVVRGQYGRGWIEGEEVLAYREEPGVDPRSQTDTYIAAKLYVDNWRWADTPFYVRAGKRLARRETTIAIQFKSAPHPPFESIAGDGLRPNVLLIHVQPDEGVSLAIGAKVPGRGDVDPDGAHGLPLRRRVPRGRARGLRAADPRRDARRRDAVHAGGRGRGAVEARRRDRRRLGPRPADVPRLRGRQLGPGALRRAAPPRRPIVAQALMGVVAEVERKLARQRCRQDADGEPELRTSTMTHVVWAPPKWLPRAKRVLAGLAERHPARTIFLVPVPGRKSGVEADAVVQDFAIGGGREVLSEVIELRLRGEAARHPASVVLPLLIADLPAYCRWRGRPDWNGQALDEIVDVCDRFVVDSNEWQGVPGAYEPLARLFDRSRRLRSRLAARASVAVGARRALARDPQDRAGLDRRPARGRAAARGLAPLATPQEGVARAP